MLAPAAYLVRRSNDIMVLPFDFSSILFVLARVGTTFSSFVYLSSSFTSLIRRWSCFIHVYLSVSQELNLNASGKSRLFYLHVERLIFQVSIGALHLARPKPALPSSTRTTSNWRGLAKDAPSIVTQRKVFEISLFCSLSPLIPLWFGSCFTTQWLTRYPWHPLVLPYVKVSFTLVALGKASTMTFPILAELSRISQGRWKYYKITWALRVWWMQMSIPRMNASKAVMLDWNP